ncbi:MAG: hypothetical protein NT069_36290, partial [Planctomycetota bacterium]|nr:hypothetical protein [Planctomycetota bacterium]
LESVNPPWGNTINRRAGCGKTARPVRREGGPKPIGPPYPYRLKITSLSGPVEFSTCIESLTHPQDEF